MAHEIIVANLKGAEVIRGKDAEIVQKEILGKLSVFTKVTNEQEQALVVAACREARKHLNDFEALRKVVKEPVLALGKQIDDMVRDFSTPIANEIDAKLKLVTAFQVAEAERVRLLQEEQNRKILEAQQQELAATKAAQLAAAAASAATNPEEQDTKELLAIRAEAIAEDARAATTQAVSVPAVAVAKPKGLVGQDKVMYKITNTALVYAKYPQFFKLEEKKAVINGTIHKDFTCEGMEIWTEKHSHLRV